jgi:hypothetical protein
MISVPEYVFCTQEKGLVRYCGFYDQNKALAEKGVCPKTCDYYKIRHSQPSNPPIYFLTDPMTYISSKFTRKTK